MPTPAPGFALTLPGLEELYHLTPTSALPPDERRALTIRRIESIRSSPTPQVVLARQDILTRLDDVQDALVTLSLATRIGASLSPALAPVARVAAGSADVLNIAMQALSLGTPTGITKEATHRARLASPGLYSTRLTRTLRTGAIAPTVGEALQIAQTTDSLFGVGMTLGAFMGLPADLLFLALRGGTLTVPNKSLVEWAALAPTFFLGSPLIRAGAIAAGALLTAADLNIEGATTLNLPRLLPIAEEDIPALDPPRPFLTWGQTVASAEGALETLAPLWELEGDLSIEDHFALTMGQYQALAVLTPFALANPDGLLVREKSPLPIRARFPSATSHLELPAAAARHDATTPALPLPGSPHEIRTAELPEILTRTGKQGPLAWTHEDPTHPLAIYAASLAGEATATLALALEGPGALAPVRHSPESTAMMIIIERWPADLPPPTRPTLKILIDRAADLARQELTRTVTADWIRKQTQALGTL